MSERARDSRRRSRPRGLLFFAFVAVLVVAVVPFGSTGPFAAYVSSFSAALLAVIVIFLRGSAPALRAPERTAWLVAAGIAAYVGLQVTGVFGLIPPHPIWKRAAAVLGEDLVGIPAIDPAASTAALPSILAPFLVFIASLRLSRRDGQSLIFLQAIGFLGGLVALVGLAQFVFAPQFLLLTEKPAYLDSVTGVFVNRNTAATYFGCTILVLLTLLQWEFRHTSNWFSALTNMIEPSERKRSRKPVVYLFLLATCLLALFLTKSRAGIACSSVSIFLHVCLSVERSRSRFGWLATIGVTALAILAGLVLFGGKAIYRAEMRGLSDDRFCVLPGIWRAALDNFPYGSGPGSFPLIFQSYRDPACGIYGFWQRAHNFFLEGSITLGLVFWIAAAVCIIGLVAIFVIGLRRRRRYRIVPALGLSTMLLLITHDLIDFSLQIPGLAIPAIATLGLCVSVSLGGKARRGSRHSPTPPPTPAPDVSE